MDFDLAKTAAAFVIVIAVGVGAMLVMPFMAQRTVLMMVLPAMVVFGLLMVALGVSTANTARRGESKRHGIVSVRPYEIAKRAAPRNERTGEARERGDRGPAIFGPDFLRERVA